jgi:ParB family transcriptional regulator, chromosome partitioning protein
VPSQTPSPSPATRRVAQQRKRPASSSTKSAGELRNSAAAAKAALARTVASGPALPLDAATGDSARTGLIRLRGAFTIPLSRLRADPLQPRREFDDVELRELASSLEKQGMLQPIRVWYVEADDVYQIISGERRFRAASIAAFTDVPCLIEDMPPAGGDRLGLLIEQIVENWQRAELRPIDLSNALAEMRDVHGKSQSDIAKSLGKSEGEVSRLLSIQKVDPALRELAKGDDSGLLNRRTLVAVASLPSEKQHAFVERIRERKLTAIQAEREARRLKSQGRGERVSRAPGTLRRFIVGNATVEVRFRKRDATNEEIADALRRAAAAAEGRDDSVA